MLVKRKTIYKFSMIMIASILLLSMVTTLPKKSSAASPVITIGYGGAKDVGEKFSTTETVSRKELVSFLEQIKKAEKSDNDLNNIRFTIAGTLVTHPIAKTLKASLSSGLASYVISSLVIDKDLGSKKIQQVLNASTAKKFKVKIRYEKHTRGAWDKWYEAYSSTVAPVK